MDRCPAEVNPCRRVFAPLTAAVLVLALVEAHLVLQNGCAGAPEACMLLRLGAVMAGILSLERFLLRHALRNLRDDTFRHLVGVVTDRCQAEPLPT